MALIQHLFSMKSHLSIPLMKCVTTSLLVTLAMVSCRTELPVPALIDLPTQRVKTQTVSSLGIYTDQISIDTALIEGTVYQINGKDSLSFRYDAQQRLVGHTSTQLFQTYGQRHTTTTQSEYSYQAGSMTEREGIGPQGSGLVRQHSLDNSGRRVATYTKRGYAHVRLDSLRTYSTEGLLLNALQTDLSPSNPPTKPSLLPNTKATLEKGNMIRREVYNTFSGTLGSITRYVYDTKHLAPLAVFTFLGEDSRNALVQKIHTVYQSNGITIEYVLKYTYYNEYDERGRMTRQTEYVQDKTYPQKKAMNTAKYYY